MGALTPGKNSDKGKGKMVMIWLAKIKLKRAWIRVLLVMHSWLERLSQRSRCRSSGTLNHSIIFRNPPKRSARWAASHARHSTCYWLSPRSNFAKPVPLQNEPYWARRVITVCRRVTWQGVHQKSLSSCAVPALLVPKKDGTWLVWIAAQSARSPSSIISPSPVLMICWI